VKLARHRHLDALCGEFLLGTLRGAARRRFDRALREEERVALRLRHWQRLFALRPSAAIEVQPDAKSWLRLRRELGLDRARPPWWQRTGFWRGWAVGATAALLLALSVNLLRAPFESPLAEVAQLAGEPGLARVAAALSADGRTLRLRASRPVLAGPQHSYELWLIPAEGGAPISLAVLGELDAQLAVPAAQVGRLRAGAKLAVSVEPAGGSPTGAPTGPVILVGEIRA
jgi:anti-sigma-K factor RskA